MSIDDAYAFSEALAENQNLVRLIMKHQYDEEVVTSIIDAVKTNTSLKHLTIEDCQTNDRSHASLTRVLRENTTNLSTLVFDSIYFTDYQMIFLWTALKLSTVKSIDFHRCTIDVPLGLAALINDCSNVTSMSVSMDFDGSSLESMRSFSLALSDNRTLAELEIRCPLFAYPSFTTTFFNGLLRNVHLTRLFLDRNPFNDGSAKALATELMYLPPESSLMIVHIDECWEMVDVAKTNRRIVFMNWKEEYYTVTSNNAIARLTNLLCDAIRPGSKLLSCGERVYSTIIQYVARFHMSDARISIFGKAGRLMQNILDKHLFFVSENWERLRRRRQIVT